MDKTRFKSSTIKGKGFYITLGVCLIAIGIATWTTYNSVMDFVKTKDTDLSSSISNKNEPIQEEKAANNTLTGIIEDTQSSEEKDVLKKATVEESQPDTLFLYPVGKEVMKPFSDCNPIYSKTFKDWRIHNGVDFLAEQGSKVKSITSGQVKDIYDDPSLGMTIVIEHDSGFTAYYSSLGDTTLVNKEDKVSAGQEIASINDIPSEICDESHLHLAVKKDDKWIDPMSILQDAK